MKILISNDDGYQAKGIECIANILADVAEICVVAPDRNRSGASNSLTLDNPIRATKADNGYIFVDGTPTDCVHLAITGLLEEEPDMVVSGINAGANLGDDVLYSGTVAAAMEGRFLGLPAIAVSLVGPNAKNYETAARVAKLIVQRLLHDPLPADTILNINVPDVPWEKLNGLEATRLGHRHKSESMIKDTNPRGVPIYWVGPPGAEQDAGPGTDFFAIKNNIASITPIHVDLTQYAALDDVSSWLKGINK
ncbi:MAG: 5'/3'-nucleotidase SurE [Gammaproteobacteria bacterium]|nr:5'/3'-nucleotidase SurE [Gammaproteobacteria bacterium]